jgi:hypothetical protein
MGKIAYDIDDHYVLEIKPLDLSISFDIYDKDEYSPESDIPDYVITGFLKWDGCLNFHTGEIAAHLCDKGEVDRLANAFKKLYEVAPQYLDGWIGGE